MPMEGTSLAFNDIVSAGGQIVSGGLTWLTHTVSTIVGSPLLSFWALLGLVGAGIGLYHRIAR